MNFIKKNLSNIVFVGFLIFLFTPFGLPVRTLLIKGVSFVTTRTFSLEVDVDNRAKLENYNWELVRDDGQVLNLEAYSEDIVVINFWATWCPPCIAEMPSFQELYDKYQGKVTFIFVAHDENDRVTKFMRDKGYTFPVYYELTPAPEPLTSTSLPTTYIIDKKGEVVVDKTGAADWNSSKVHNLLDNLLQ